MVRIRASKVIMAPIGEVWKIISDPKKIAEIDPYVNSVRIIEQRGNIILIEVESEYKGSIAKVIQRLYLFPPRRMETEIVRIEKGFTISGVGGKSIILLEEIPMGTRIHYEEDILQGWRKILYMLHLVSRNKLQDLAEKFLDAIKERAERKSS